jgi:hypothetical protein
MQFPGDEEDEADVPLPDLLKLIERWRRAGAALKRLDPKRFAAHLEAVEHDCVGSRPRKRPRRLI